MLLTHVLLIAEKENVGRGWSPGLSNQIFIIYNLPEKLTIKRI